jgi:hypothetical protein
MISGNLFKQNALVLTMALTMVCALAACGEPRAVMLPLEYPDGSAVQTASGVPVMAGYQTYGTAFHANATALYVRAAPVNCIACAHVGTVVTEPSIVRQTTGVLGASTVGAGAVMGGLGAMNYGNAALDGKLGTNVTNTSSNSSSSSAQDDRGHYPQPHDDHYAHYDDRRGYGGNGWGGY